MSLPAHTSSTGYPNFAGKHEQDAIISPDVAVAVAKANPDLRIPDAVVLTYQPELLEELTARGLRPTDGYPGRCRSLWFVPGDSRRVAVAGGFGVGAPAAAIVLEELIALGVRRFISIGSAGCLQPQYAFGTAIVCTGAIRDEGVSHHYIPSEKFAWPSENLTLQLTSAFKARRTVFESGLTWTIDAPYRETLAEARNYQADGVLCVEMEAAALFTVGRYRGIEVASAFAVSDHLLTGDRWTHAFNTPELRDGLVGLLDTALAALNLLRSDTRLIDGYC